MLVDAGLLSKARLLSENLPTVPGKTGRRERTMLPRRRTRLRGLAVLSTTERPRSVGLLMVSKPGMSYMTVIPLS
jgi:hypothetical protein